MPKGKRSRVGVPKPGGYAPRVKDELAFECLSCGQAYTAMKGPRGFCSTGCVDEVRAAVELLRKRRSGIPALLREPLVDHGFASSTPGSPGYLPLPQPRNAKLARADGPESASA